MHARFGFVFASILFAVGCGSSDDAGPTPATDSGTSDATTDSAKSDAANDTGGDTGSGDTGTTMDAAGVVCGSEVCGTGQVCCASGDPDSGFMLACVTGMACPDGGAALKCDGPEDCPTGAKICCAEVAVEGSGFACTFKTGVAECRGTCNTMVPASCPNTATVRRCQKHADCTEAETTNCCEFSSGGSTAKFCTPDWMTGFGDCTAGD